MDEKMWTSHQKTAWRMICGHTLPSLDLGDLNGKDYENPLRLTSHRAALDRVAVRSVVCSLRNPLCQARKDARAAEG